MKDQALNELAQCGTPLFYKLASVGSDVTAPDIRLGEAIRLRVRSLSGMQKEAIAVSARTGLAWRLASDEGAYLAGLDEAPCPLSFLSTGMISSYMHEILALAKIRQIDIDHIRLVQDNYYTMEGSALKGTMVGGAKDVHLTAQISSRSERAVLMRLVGDAVSASPLNGLLRGNLPSLFSLTHNGRPIDTGKAAPLPGNPLADTNHAFGKPDIASGNWDKLIIRGGQSPKAPHTVTMANDSLAEHQSRLLHIRAICTVADDGVKRIEQHLYNPHGSVFHFLCDEAPENGGQARAPDAATYVSAGIGFCFMTQLGRYAQITKQDLREYRIIQDTHFSLGGASAQTGTAGHADPVETHVFVQTGESDDFARTLLDMSEQTCFLHALCKTDLKTRVLISTFDEEIPLEIPA